MPSSLPETVRELIEWGADRLDAAGLVFGHGTDNAYDEAAMLVLSALQLDMNLPPGDLDARVDPADVRQATELLDMRITTRKPAAYLTHEAWFAGMPFYVDERVLVPRSPIAELIENRFVPWIRPERVARILDLCTGSGCIACACAREFPTAYVDASDLSADALSVARRNIARHGLEQRVTLLQSDLFAAITADNYDIIISNPPYVPREEVGQLPSEFCHEPSLALAAGEDGLDIAIQILNNAHRYLSETGILVVEVGHTWPVLEAVFPDVPFTWLEFEFGGEGVFLLGRDQLDTFRDSFERVAGQRMTT
ncbi:MAG: 50S ribosomal protein L3 N(5)-glutamine methyltransferase [Gammaproteobacteria bacterium]|nr:MAG: 50S ribosomal protein L3 N(5)-glutamine methyltransferase [Gammaproteobacteria bacterium]